MHLRRCWRQRCHLIAELGLRRQGWAIKIRILERPGIQSSPIIFLFIRINPGIAIVSKTATARSDIINTCIIPQIGNNCLHFVLHGTRVKLCGALYNKLAVVREGYNIYIIVCVLEVYHRRVVIKALHIQIVCRIGIEVGEEDLVVGV